MFKPNPGDKPVYMSDAEWSGIIAIIANSHPLIAKISTQLVTQQREIQDAGIKAHPARYDSEEKPAMGAYPRERGTQGLSGRPSNSDGERGSQEGGEFAWLKPARPGSES